MNKNLYFFIHIGFVVHILLLSIVVVNLMLSMFTRIPKSEGEAQLGIRPKRYLHFYTCLQHRQSHLPWFMSFDVPLIFHTHTQSNATTLEVPT